MLVKTDDVRRPEVKTAIADLERQAIATGQFSTPTDVDVNKRRHDRASSRSRRRATERTPSIDRAETLRNDVVPATVGKLTAPTSA